MSNIRRATGEDIPAIVAVWEEAVRATHGFLTEDEISFYKCRMPQYLKAVDLYVFKEDGFAACGIPKSGSTDGGAIKGFSGISGNKLEMLFVSERGAGIGSELLEHALQMGVNEVDVNEENGQAAGFYLAKGFVQTGRSETDEEGKPHPIIHLAMHGSKSGRGR